ncbi:MAG: hypothetical protein AOA65_2274 [Candidatus Bathyarchaeota archaeon BA1]|nr:MAG: hypothetical protein AOA65_2274 [Candidatus Bathyarchaeota archaeon BA1]
MTMYLTPEEERVLDGEHGWAYQVSMKILAKLGDLFGATRLIPIKSAHISGVSYKTMGDAPIDFLEALTSAGGKAQVPSTLNPSCFDPDYPSQMGISEGQREKQLRIIDLYGGLGVDPALTCTPYYLHKLGHGCHLAWSESSAVIYANSVLGALTNREGSPSALAASLIGKTPDYGMHQAENREANILVRVESDLRNGAEFGALGVHLGRMLKDKVPVFEGLTSYTDEDLKQLGAGLASSGMVSVFHYNEPCEKGGMETISIEAKDIRNAIESLSTATEAPDLIFIGCPHCSINEMKSIAQALNNKKVREKTKLWVCTSRHVKGRSKKYVDIIESAGGHVLCDTCAIVTWIKNLGINTMLTNSAKAAYYAPTLNQVNAILAPLNECTEASCG